MNKFRHHSSGLILIEVAIAMIIFSLCIGAVLMVMQHSQFAQQSSTTNQHRSIIIQALNRYHQREGYIPCPSKPIADDGFALEKCQGAYQQIGILPYKTLGLPAKIARDGQGHYFTYAVSELATHVQIDKDTSVTANTLQVLDTFGRQYGSRTHEISYVLISHGSKGSGAFTLQPSRKRFPTRTEFEAENAKDTLIFYADIPPKDSEHEVFFIARSDLDMPTTITPSLKISPADDVIPVSEDDPYGQMVNEE